MLKRCSVTYSGCFTGYVINNGIQTILFQTFDRSELDSLCKEFYSLYPHIYVDENFNIHKIYKYNV